MNLEKEMPMRYLLRRISPAYLLAVFICLNFIFMFLILHDIGDLKEGLASNKIVASMVTAREDEEFIKNVCDDLGLKNEVVMIVGPYYVQSFFERSKNYYLSRLLSKYPVLVDPEDPTGRILMRESIYSELTPEERRAILAHELWHIHALVKEGPKFAGFNINKEFKANRFAAQYVNPDVLIKLYRKYGDGSAEVQRLIDDLGEQKGEP